MLKSIYLNNLLNNISQLNNNLAFYLFAMEGFEGESAEMMQANPDSFLRETYPQNKFSNALNILNKNFPVYSLKYKDELYKNIYINLFSYMDYYLDNLLSFIRKILELNNEDIEMKNGNDISKMEKIIMFLHIEKEDIDNLEILKTTYDYIRLRRNCLIHNDGDSTAALKNINDKRLRQYWETQLSRKTSGADKTDKRHIFNIEYTFEKSNASKFNTNEIIGLFNVVRRLANLLDVGIMRKTIKDHKDGFLLYNLNEFKKANKNNKITIDTRGLEKKVFGFTFRLFGYKMEKSDIDWFYSSLANK